MSPVLNKIDELMKQKRWDEAEQALGDFFASDVLYDEERGRAFITYTISYLEALTKLNLEYRAALESAAQLLKKTAQIEAEMKEDIDLQQLTAEIDSLGERKT